MKRISVLVFCFFLGMCWSCARPEDRVKRVDPLESVPSKVAPQPEEE